MVKDGKLRIRENVCGPQALTCEAVHERETAKVL